MFRASLGPIVLSLLAAAADLAVGRAATLELTPVADTSLIENAPSNNLGGAPFVNAGTTGPDAGSRRNRGLLRFDLAGGLPRGSWISRASLVLEVVKEPSVGGTASTFGLHRLLQRWEEGSGLGTANPGLGAPARPGEATWDSRSFGSTNDWSAPGGVAGTDYLEAESGSAPIYGTANSPYAFEHPLLLEDVRLWLVQPAANFGWLLATRNEAIPSTARRFGAREDPQNAPRLNIDFVVPPRIDRWELTNGQFALEFEADAGQSVTVVAADALTDPSPWRAVASFPSSSLATRHRISEPLSIRQRIYALRSGIPAGP